MYEEQLTFAKDVLAFKTGGGKDAKIFITFKVKKNNELIVYNIPLLTLNSLQLWTSKPKIPRYVMGSAQPVGLSTGVRSISGHIVATTENESIGMILRDKLKDYKPIKAIDLNLDINGIVSIEKLDELRYLDELPPCQIQIFLSNPVTKKVYSKAVYGVTFSSESHALGTGASMIARYSFVATNISSIRKEEVSKKKI